MEKYAFFIDIDGTLTSFDSERSVPLKNIEAINEAVSKGHFVFINTGRSYGNIDKKLLKTLPMLTGVVCGNGSDIKMNGKTVFSSFFSVDILCEISAYLLEHKKMWAKFEGEQKIYCLGTKLSLPYEGFELVTEADDLKNKYSEPNIETIAIGPEIGSDFKEMFSERVNLFPMGRYYDCSPAGCTKATGLTKAAMLCGVKPENCVAIGDAGNDLLAMKAAGIAVAVANATDAIKAQADITVASNDEAGVAQAIRMIINK